METNFNFKSQPCSSREQSKRLLALGLKKETADCYWFYCDIAKEWKCTILSSTQVFEDYPTTVIPAWSMYRLSEMMPEEMYGGLLCIFKDSIRYEEVIMDRLEAHFEVIGDNMYENAISCIEWLIKEGYFSKEYLCEN